MYITIQYICIVTEYTCSVIEYICIAIHCIIEYELYGAKIQI